MAPPSAIAPTLNAGKDSVAVKTTEIVQDGYDSSLKLGPKTAAAVEIWKKEIRGGFGTLPVAIESAKNATLKDIDGKEYIDFIAMFAVMNMGHAHPKIVEAAVEQMYKAPLVNAAWVNPYYTKLADRLTKKFGYDTVTAMMSGSEAAESAIKIARKWAYLKKGIPANEAWVLTTDKCFHGLTLATMPLSNVIADHYGQHVPKVGPWAPSTGKVVEFGSLDDLREAFEADGDKIAAFMIEPIQGAAGVRIPPDGYLAGVSALCKKYNVLFICDEVQTGFGRAGTALCYQYEPGVKPDLITMGKALTGGLYPLSMVMGTHEVMDVVSRFEIASTFAAPPPACAAALAALDVLEQEDLPARSARLGDLLYEEFERQNAPYVLEYRGKGRGLFHCIVIDESKPGVTGRRVAALCALRGVLVGNTANRIRFSPPLTISEEDLKKGAAIVASALRDVEHLGDFPGSEFLV